MREKNISIVYKKNHTRKKLSEKNAKLMNAWSDRIHRFFSIYYTAFVSLYYMEIILENKHILIVI